MDIREFNNLPNEELPKELFELDILDGSPPCTTFSMAGKREETWGKKYPSSVASWRNNWAQLSTYFKYPAEIRKIIYTTNAIENFNRQLRKVTKSKTIFPTDDALFKTIYLAMCDITEKWTGAGWNWGQTLN